MKEGSEKVGLQLNIQKINIMTSGPITSWQIDEETVADYFLSSNLNADDDCRHEIKTLPFWKGSYDQPKHCITQQSHGGGAKMERNRMGRPLSLVQFHQKNN